MRFEVDRGSLSQMLAVVGNLLPSRTTYPILQNVMLEVTSGKLRVSGTDLDTYARKEIVLSGDFEEGRCLLPCRKLGEMCREFAGETVSCRSKDTNIHFESGGSKATFSGLDPAEFPEMPKVPEAAALDFPISTVLELVEMVSFAVSKDEARPAMGGLNWEVAKTSMKMVATDGHRLAYVSRKGKFSATFTAIVSPKLFALLPREQKTVTVRVDPGRVAFETQDTLAIGRPLEGPYPDYERVLPKKEYPFRAVLEHEAFFAGLRRAAVFANPLGRPVALEFSSNKLKLSAETPDVGSSEEEMACEYQGDRIRIGFNAGYIMEALRHLNAQKLVFELQNPLSAGLIKALEKNPEQEEVFLLMPIRLD